jgi:hypothetical protein
MVRTSNAIYLGMVCHFLSCTNECMELPELQKVNYQTKYWMNTVLNLLQLCFGVSKVDLGAINTTVDYKPTLKCLIFGLFYFHPTTGFSLSRSSSGDFYNYTLLLLESRRFDSHWDYWIFQLT